MSNTEYLFLRLLRRSTPELLINCFKKNNFLIKPGLETLNPRKAVSRYEEVLKSFGTSVKNCSVMIFGYGGTLEPAIMLLNKGCRHVYLCDKYARLDRQNLPFLFKGNERFFTTIAGKIDPNPQYITMIHEDIISFSNKLSVDLVLSSNVFEHIRTELISNTIAALGGLTGKAGLHLHFIDLRDHYFKYPFHMLKYSDKVWRQLLNPKTNLNRLRLADYQMLFSRYFKSVDIKILENDEEKFILTSQKIRRQFLTGQLKVDSATKILVIASNRRKGWQ